MKACSMRSLVVACAAVWTVSTVHGDAVGERMAQMVQENVENPWPGLNTVWGDASYALACLAADTNVVEGNEAILRFFDQWPVPDSDTTAFDSYFPLHLVWRMYHDDAMHARLTAEARDRIENAMWRFIRTRSRVGEANGDEWIIHASENHNAMQRGSYLLCAEALMNAGSPYGPDRVLSDGRTIAEHAAAWTDYFIRYFPSRAREGIHVEIASPVYAKYTLGVYYNLRDFADSARLRELADRLISLHWADTAGDWTLNGTRGGARTRSPKNYYLRQGTVYSFHQVLWGYGWHGHAGTVRTYGLIPAVSPYRIPGVITAAASDPDRPPYLYTSRRFGRGGAWDANQNYQILFDGGGSSLRRETWVTPEYSMGTLTRDMNKDYIALLDQWQSMDVFFASGPNDRIVVYGKGNATEDKSFADLNGVTRTNCMVVQRNKRAYSSGDGMLVYLSNAIWEQRVETNGWVFSQGGGAYSAVRLAGGGYTVSVDADGAVLTLDDMWSPVVVQMGRVSDYADFEAFRQSVLANSLAYADGILTYTSEAGDVLTFYANSTTTPKVNGTTVDLNPDKTYDNPYLSMVHGEDVATVSYPGFNDLALDFSTPLPLGEVSLLRSESRLAPFENQVTFSFDAGRDATKLVVAVASELSGHGTVSVTYNGTPLSQAAEGALRSLGIWYLDEPYTGGAADLVVDLSSFSVVNGIGVAAVSLFGAEPGVAASALAMERGVSVEVPEPNSFVMVGYAQNQPGGTVSVNAPLIGIYSGDIGSADGAAGIANRVGMGTHHYSFTGTGEWPGTVAAVFSPDTDRNNDGIHDLWAEHYFSGEADAPDFASADPNTNGFTNLEAYIAGTDPLDPLDVPRLSMDDAGGALRIMIPSRETTPVFYGSRIRTYTLEATPTLAPPAWSVVDGTEELPATGDVLAFTIPDGDTQRFFRATIRLRPVFR